VKGKGKFAAGHKPIARVSRLEQVMELLADIMKWQYPADQCISRYFRANPKMGARDRAEVAEAVFDVLRHLRRYRRDAQSCPVRLQECLAWRGLYATSRLQAQFQTGNKDLDEWLARCDSIDPQSLPFAVRYSLPEWLAERFLKMPQPESLAGSLLKSAPIDLRVNTLKSDRNQVLEQIRGMFESDKTKGFTAEPTPFSDVGIRIGGHPPIQKWGLFEKGVIEVQDEGSQLLAKLVDPKRHEMVIDFCAGAGGKTLALGAMMASTGRLYAFDISAARLARAKPRFARSGLSNIYPVVIRPEKDDRVVRLSRKAHRVLVDAPCTGLGTLRRNPDLKWRLQQEELERLLVQQASILDQASACVRPGGRLVYATCSLLAEENEMQVHAFLERNKDFELVHAGDMLPKSLLETEFSALDEHGMLHLRPDWHGTDGFFAAVMLRKD